MNRHRKSVSLNWDRDNLPSPTRMSNKALSAKCSVTHELLENASGTSEAENLDLLIYYPLISENYVPIVARAKVEVRD